MDRDEGVCRPTPAPRRLYPELKKMDYENVAIDMINKNLNINSENIHDVGNCTEKIVNNKILLNAMGEDELSGVGASNGNVSAIGKSILTETNDLYGPNVNETIDMDVMQSTPTPAPRPRKPQKNTNDVYENVNINILPPKSHDAYENVENEYRRSASNLSRYTGAISKDTFNHKIIRRAPELPPKTYFNIDNNNRIDERESRRNQRFSITSEMSTTSVNDNSFSNLNDSKKSGSSLTLNSSMGDSVDSSESSKFKSPSPGYVQLDVQLDEHELSNCNLTDSSDDLEHSTTTMTTTTTTEENNELNDLLKSLGSTSKLLTESIGERVAIKAQGAKHKLDKNLKTSTELLSNLGSETTARLKNVTKRFGTNFTLGKSENKRKNTSVGRGTHEVRPQTLPPNDKVFNSITFTSPLSKKANAVVDLTEEVDEVSYEIPKSNKPLNTESETLPLPTYEEAIRTSPVATLSHQQRTSDKNNTMLPKSVAAEAANIALKKQQNNVEKQPGIEEKSTDSSDALSRDFIDMLSLPMPTYPPPALPANITNANEGLYGRVNHIKPPVRRKRQKNEEQIELRKNTENDNISMRANIDSTELERLNLEVIAAQRKDSLNLREQIEMEEQHLPNPDRSNSWEYFKENGDDENECSSPEPVYANQDATYGKVFEMASTSSNLLNRSYSVNDDEMLCGAVGGISKRPPSDVILEFDPLSSRNAASTHGASEKSNQLLLLEHLLEQDTYGDINNSKLNCEDDDVSMCTSEEDNLNVSSPTARQQKPKTLVLPTPAIEQTTTAKRIQIVHQNSNLHSQSMENIVEMDESDAKIKPYLCKFDDLPNSTAIVDLAPPSQQRTTWFVSDNKENFVERRINPFDKMDNLDDTLPSYLEAVQGNDKGTPLAQEQKPMLKGIFKKPMDVFSNFKIHVEGLKRKQSFKASQKTTDVRCTLQMIPRPSLSPVLIRYEGPLVRFPSGVVEDILKEMQHRKVILRDRQFQTFLDSELKNPKENIPLEDIVTIQCVSNSRVTDNSTHFYCFEITTCVPRKGGIASSGSSSNIMTMSNPNLLMTASSSGNCKQQRVSHLYGVVKESERDVWMQKILESLTNTLELKHLCHYYRAGWCYLKKSITAEWTGTWLVLKKSRRRLIFVTESMGNQEELDLRKARCIVLKDSDDSITNLHVENGPMIMIDCPPMAVYMIMSAPRETKIWRHIISEVAHNNGFSLADQQLTKFNVPVIVDKCINFIYIYGSMSEGIYRKSGSENSILKLLNAFRANAFNVEITRNEYNEHDVANVLKRFMRDLPERLIGKQSQSFMAISELKVKPDKIDSYSELINRLSTIERETLKKIVGHLAFISSLHLKNKMTVQNLTTVWGPTILKYVQTDEQIYSQKQSDVLFDLIKYHKILFPQTAEEIKKEAEMRVCLEKYYASAETLTDSVKKSGDIKVWIILNPNPDNTNEEKMQVNVTISPTKTAYAICKELAPKMKMPIHQISLYEIILNDTLERPLHHNTEVFHILLNWMYWPENDRKHNYLVVKPNDFLRDINHAIRNMPVLTPTKELKFVDNRTKSFKTFECELRNGRLIIRKKDKNEDFAIVLKDMNIYLGCEKKRDFPWCWAFTFIEKTTGEIKRSRDSPYFGHVLAGTNRMDRTIWFASIWYHLYRDDVLPPAEIIIK